MIFAIATILLFLGLGLPFTFCLPNDLRDRTSVAPVLGLGLMGIAETIGYFHGLHNLVTLAAVLIATTSYGWALFHHQFRTSVATFSIFGAWLSAICLLPLLLYGFQDHLFYSNPTDKLNYISIASGMGVRSFSELSNLAPTERSTPIIAAATNLFARPTAPLLLTRLKWLFGYASAEAIIPFEAVLQAITAFGIYFFLRNSFLVNRPRSIFCATAFSIGFFSQYIVDIDALSSLSALSFAPAALALIHRMASTNSPPHLPVSVPLGLLVAAQLYFYPEAIPALLIPALGMSAIFLFAYPRRLVIIAHYGASVAVAAILTFPIWQSTLSYLSFQAGVAQMVGAGWFLIFDKFFLGDVGLHDPPSFYKDLSIPINLAMGFIGLFFLAPPDWLPYAAKLVWKIAEGIFVMALFATAFIHSTKQRNAAIYISCLMSVALPLVLCVRGEAWAAGKAVTTISPIIFSALVFTIGTRRWISFPAIVLASTSLIFGLQRAILPTLLDDRKLALGYPLKVAELDRYSWDVSAWKKTLDGCKKIDLNVTNPYLSRLVETIALDSGVPYDSSIDRLTYYGEGSTVMASPRDGSADCLITNQTIGLQGER